ncbi:MAG: methyltransferase [Chitinivibrionales bacterium]|nr:methyltransferase [Chitinivibrionales bacterium]
MTWKRGHNVNVLEEEHHRIYGSKWALGLDQYEYLVSHGLQPGHRLLDFGCGAGRAGIHLIDYLDPGNYTGVDGHESGINAFQDYEIPLNRLGPKDPDIRLLDLEKEPFGEEEVFDYVIAFSVFNHMRNHAPAAHNVSRALKNGGLLVATFGIPHNFGEFGLTLIKSERTQSRLVPTKTIDWFILRKESGE